MKYRIKLKDIRHEVWGYRISQAKLKQKRIRLILDEKVWLKMQFEKETHADEILRNIEYNIRKYFEVQGFLESSEIALKFKHFRMDFIA